MTSVAGLGGRVATSRPDWPPMTFDDRGTRVCRTCTSAHQARYRARLVAQKAS